MRIGIAWRGSATHLNDHFRSTSIESLTPLFDVSNVAFYSLQIDEAGQDLQRVSRAFPNVQDLSSLQSDLADTVAIVKQLDLIITVDTAILHLCAALGLPTWGLIARRCVWRWRDSERDDSPWYRSLTLFRQSKHNDWPELIGRVREALLQIIADGQRNERFPASHVPASSRIFDTQYSVISAVDDIEIASVKTDTVGV